MISVRCDGLQSQVHIVVRHQLRQRSAVLCGLVVQHTGQSTGDVTAEHVQTLGESP